MFRFQGVLFAVGEVSGSGVRFAEGSLPDRFEVPVFLRRKLGHVGSATVFRVGGEYRFEAAVPSVDWGDARWLTTVDRVTATGAGFELVRDVVESRYETQVVAGQKRRMERVILAARPRGLVLRLVPDFASAVVLVPDQVDTGDWSVEDWDDTGDSQIVGDEDFAPEVESAAEIAAAAVPVRAEFFVRPARLGGHTVTPEGHVHGYLVRWADRHSNDGVTRIEDSAAARDMSLFLTGVRETDRGETIAVGRISLRGGHSPDAEGDLSNVAAHVTAGADDVGIWYSGEVLPGLSPEFFARFQGASVSGHWRAGDRRLIHIAAVNAPGFPQPQEVAAVRAAFDAGWAVLAEARVFTRAERDEFAEDGVALPDGSWPIPDEDALRRALQGIGRAGDRRAEVEAHIRRRAEALGLTDSLPDWVEAAAVLVPLPGLVEDTEFFVDAVLDAVLDDVWDEVA